MLSEVPQRAEAADRQLECELEPRHPGPHHAIGVYSRPVEAGPHADGTAVRWADRERLDVVAFARCPSETRLVRSTPRSAPSSPGIPGGTTATGQCRTISARRASDQDRTRLSDRLSQLSTREDQLDQQGFYLHVLTSGTGRSSAEGGKSGGAGRYLAQQHARPRYRRSLGPCMFWGMFPYCGGSNVRSAEAN